MLSRALLAAQVIGSAVHLMPFGYGQFGEAIAMAACATAASRQAVLFSASHIYSSPSRGRPLG